MLAVSEIRKSQKIKQIHGQECIDRYLKGRVIDIELAGDLVALLAEIFDEGHGDANLVDELCVITGCDLVHGSRSL